MIAFGLRSLVPYPSAVQPAISPRNLTLSAESTSPRVAREDIRVLPRNGSRGRLCSRVRAGKAEPGAKFADYFEFSELLAKLPSHRILALFRGEKEEVLTLELVPDAAAPDRGEPSAFERQIANRFKIVDHGRPADCWLIETVRLAWRTGILGHIESDLRLRLWQVAEDTAVRVFAGNLRDLLL